MAFLPLVATFTAQALLTAWLICYTPRNSLWRPAAAPIVLALYITTTLRGISTTLEVSGIQHGTEASASRSAFLIRTLAIVVAKYLVLDLMTFQPSSPEDTQALFGEGREYLLFRPEGVPPVTIQAILTNLGVTVLGWGPIGSWFIEEHYRILSLISVGLGVSSPHQWPVLFGAITEAYTLRRFWGTFWHQLFRWPMQGISTFLCTSILRLPRRSLVERYAKIIFVFVVSSAIHLAIDGRAGILLPRTGALRCFLVQPLGIMLEDGVQELYRRVRVCGGGEVASTKWTRMAGYIWVWSFLALAAPLYNFPLFRYQDPARNGVPVSVIRLAMGYFV
ncbi:membrane bound O-acyl transferase family-domain-containing protein [Aspergillus varians]